MKNWFLLILTLVLSVGIYVPYSLAASTQGTPFNDVWKAINDLRVKVAALSAGSAGGQLHVFDGAGQDLGLLASVEQGEYIVYNPSSDTLIKFSNRYPQPTVLLPHNLGDNNFYFSEANCQGTPYIDYVGVRYLYPMQNVGSNSGFYAPNLNDVPASPTIRSQQRAFDLACITLDSPVVRSNSIALYKVDQPFTLLFVRSLTIEIR